MKVFAIILIAVLVCTLVQLSSFASGDQSPDIGKYVMYHHFSDFTQTVNLVAVPLLPVPIPVPSSGAMEKPGQGEQHCNHTGG